MTVYNKNGREIDFLAQKAQKEYLIQVAYSVAEEKHTPERICIIQCSGPVQKKDNHNK